MRTWPTCGDEGVPALVGRPVASARAAAEAGDLSLLGCFEPVEPVHYVCAASHAWHVDDESQWQADLVAALRMHGYEDAEDDV